MSTLVYPSPAFPGPPSVTFDVPDGWEPVHAPGTTMAATLPRPRGFAPSVVVSIDQCGPDFTLDSSLAQIESVAQSRGGTVSEPFAARLAGAEYVGCDATWPDPEVDTILQANLFTLVRAEGGPAACHVVQLTGAVGGATAEEDYDLIRSVISSVRVTPWSAAGSQAHGSAAASADAPAGTPA